MKNNQKRRGLLLLLALIMALTACQQGKDNSSSSSSLESPVSESSSLESSLSSQGSIEASSAASSEELSVGDLDEATGLKKVGDLDLRYAKQYSLEELEQGAWIYTDDGGKKTYLLPEGVKLKEDKAEAVTIPVKRTAILSTSYAAFLGPLDKLDTVVATSSNEKSWLLPAMQDRLKKGEAVYIGETGQENIEELQKTQPDLLLTSNDNMQYNPSMVDSLKSTQLSWISIAEYKENDPRAYLEWIKLFGILTGEREKAESFFNKECQAIDAIEKKTGEEKKKVYAWVTPFDGKYYVSDANGYTNKMLEIAGARTAFPDLGFASGKSTELNEEAFYKGAKEADLLINGSLFPQSLDDFVKTAGFMKDTRAYQDKNIWGIKPVYFQSMDKISLMIQNLYDILHGEAGSLKDTDFFYRMDLYK